MTVIAFDGKTLAADRLVVFGNTKGSVTKVFRVGAHLVGIAGSASLGMEALEWFKGGADPSKYPERNRESDSGASLLVIRPDRTAWKYESSPYPFQLEGPYCAIGCGDEAALVAMSLGKTAAEAVEIASQHNVFCGNGVDALTL